MFLELDIEAKMYVVCPYNFPIGFPLVLLSAAQMACSFPLAKCWLPQTVQDAEFPSLSLPLFAVDFFSSLFGFVWLRFLGFFSGFDLLGE